MYQTNLLNIVFELLFPALELCHLLCRICLQGSVNLIFPSAVTQQEKEEDYTYKPKPEIQV